MEKIYEIMPKGWEEAAKEKKALVRGRKVKTAKELLRLNFLYQTSGESYGLTAALTQISENQEGLNKTAVQKRIVKSGDWLKWICVNTSIQEGFLTEKPEWLKKYRVCVVDASDYTVQGSRGADFRLHYMAELFSLNATEMYFTTAKEGETLTRYTQIKENDLIIADRAYGTITGINHVLEYKANYLIRLRSNSFNLYDSQKNKYDLTEELKKWEPGKKLDLNLYIKSGKKYIPVRICAIGKTEEQIKKGEKHLRKSNKSRKALSPLQSIWNKYIVVVTSLSGEIPIEHILELYRMRWQIELIFKRFKSIFGGREFTARKKEAVEAWFYGKLLLAIICETFVKKGRFSP